MIILEIFSGIYKKCFLKQLSECDFVKIYGYFTEKYQINPYNNEYGFSVSTNWGRTVFLHFFIFFSLKLQKIFHSHTLQYTILRYDVHIYNTVQWFIPTIVEVLFQEHL